MPNVALEKNIERIVRGGVAYYRAPKFADGKTVLHAFSTRQGGVSLDLFDSLNLSFKVGDDPLRVRQNRNLLTRALGIRPEQFVIAEQVHGDGVLEAGKNDRGKCLEPGGFLGEGDALITREKGLALMVLVADCLPVLFHDPVHKAIGASHAGWRGTVGHTAVKTLIQMGGKYGTQPQEVKVVLGPCIGPCCYEVGEDVMREFMGVFPWASDVFNRGFAGRWMLDLPEANARQLVEIGVKPENINRSGLCTIDKIKDFYSHRAEAIPSSFSPSRIATSSRDATFGRADSNKESALEAIPSSFSPSRIATSSRDATVGRADPVRGSAREDVPGGSTGRIGAVIMLK